MVKLTNLLGELESNASISVIKREIEMLHAHLLPLQQGLQYSSYVSDEPIQVTVLNVEDEADLVRVRFGVIYMGVIAGCSCADDPTPLDTVSEYCTVEMLIDRMSANAEFNLVE